MISGAKAFESGMRLKRGSPASTTNVTDNNKEISNSDKTYKNG